ncbi:MAG: RNA polymerase-binding protein RbpA [Micrococcales bacterium]
MANESMRGMRLGASSLESDRNVKFEARVKYSYQCPAGHVTELAFATDADVPETWDCKTCSRSAILIVDGVVSQAGEVNEKTPRSHWEMLLERRTIAELQELLDEQLANLRERRASAAAKVSHH